MFEFFANWQIIEIMADQKSNFNLKLLAFIHLASKIKRFYYKVLNVYILRFFTLFGVVVVLLLALLLVRSMMASTRLRLASRSFSSCSRRLAISSLCLSASSRALRSCSSRSAFWRISSSRRRASSCSRWRVSSIAWSNNVL